MSPSSDRNLLFGILALQRGFVRPEQLIHSLHAWALTPERCLADFLLEQQALTREQRGEIDRLVVDRLSRDGTPLGQPASPLQLRYLREKFHARGGQGEVFRARDTELNRAVALKQLHERWLEDSQARALFRLEAEVTGNLEHPGIVPVYGLGTDEEARPYYAMRFIQGESLSEAIARFHGTVTGPAEAGGRALALRQLLGRFLTICQTVAFAHSRGILHRDLKPSNIMLGRFGETLVVDWGLAWPLRSEAGDSTRSMSCGVGTWPPMDHRAGTRPYMAPEQWGSDPAALGRHTDVYLLGGILFEILTGQPPHPGGVHKPFPVPESVPAVPPGLLGIARKALAPIPAERHASAEELAQAVERWLAEEPLAEYRLTLERLETLVEREPGVAAYREELARQRVNPGLVLGGMSRPFESEQIFRQAVEEYERLLEDQPQQARLRAELGAARVHLARALGSLGRSAEAEQVQAAARADFERLLATSPDDYQLASVRLTILPGANLNVPPPPEGGDTIYPQPPEPSGTSQAPGPMDSDRPFDPESTVDALPPTSVPGAPASGTLLPGTLESGYAIERIIAQGGGSRVYLALDRSLRRRVAIKTLQLSDHSDIRTRFQREARVMACLEHPNICVIHAVGESSSEGPFLVMRHVSDESLLDRLRGTGSRFPEPGLLRQLLRVLIGASRGLAYSHRHGVIHRDPKPANIMIGDSGEGVVIDWGLAGLIGDADTHFDLRTGAEDAAGVITAEGAIVGTPAYMSPEAAQGRSAELDARSDIFTLGVVLFEILTGETPFRRASVVDLLLALVTEEIPRVRQRQPAAPAYLDVVCARAMARDPDQRYQSADDFADALQHWLDRPTHWLARSWFALRERLAPPRG
jgi:serine/threonine protein kinase